MTMVVNKGSGYAILVDVLRLAGYTVQMERGNPFRGGAVDHLHAGMARKSYSQQRHGEQREQTTSQDHALTGSLEGAGCTTPYYAITDPMDRSATQSTHSR